MLWCLASCLPSHTQISLVLWTNTSASLSISWSLSCHQQGQPQKPEDKNKETKSRETRQFTNKTNVLSQLVSFSYPSETWRIIFSNIRLLFLTNIFKNQGLRMTNKRQVYTEVVCWWCRKNCGCQDGRCAFRSASTTSGLCDDGRRVHSFSDKTQFPHLCVSRLR